jgi:signal transduction histidine kinase
MVSLLARLTPTRWLRAPRPTARLRLTLLYGTLFLLSGAAVLTVTYLLAAHATAITLPGGKTGSAPGTARYGCIGSRCPRAPAQTKRGRGAFGGTRSKPPGAPRASSAAGNHVVHLTPSQGAHLQAEVTHLHDVAMRQLLIRSGLTLAVMTVLSIALGWLMAGRVLRPVRTINAAARQISASNLHERLSLDGPDDEFRELAATLDDLLKRLHGAFDSQRRFVANASHELRTPLTLDRALLERALRKSEPTQAFWRATCERLLASSQQQNRLIDALLTLARSDGAVDRRECFDLGAMICSVLRNPELDAAKAGLHVQTRIDSAPVTGDPSLLERLIHNLIDNAIRHNVPNGHVEVTAQLRSGHAVLTVTNTGPLVPVGEVERLLQPFQRADTDRTTHGEGLGLGLSIVLAIATAHDADLTLNPQTKGGLRIEVSFPAPGSQNERSPHNPTTTSPSAIPLGQTGQPGNQPMAAAADQHHPSPRYEPSPQG